MYTEYKANAHKAGSLPLGSQVRYNGHSCYIVAHHAKSFDGSQYICLGSIEPIGKSPFAGKKQMERWGYPKTKWISWDETIWNKCSFFIHIFDNEVLTLDVNIVGQKCIFCSAKLEHKKFAASQYILCDFCRVCADLL